ncbi:hypothetical protein PI124_g16584 [Phytophthora idaei]|nr:hypothetical protein PI125_g15835 [Phytophthora idaei]KAG3238450.1 hypothetical protein PI124_g16584 [Phytophthora idaei]
MKRIPLVLRRSAAKILEQCLPVALVLDVALALPCVLVMLVVFVEYHRCRLWNHTSFETGRIAGIPHGLVDIEARIHPLEFAGRSSRATTPRSSKMVYGPDEARNELA